MVEEYKVSIGTKLLYSLGTCGMFVFFLWLSTVATTKGIIPSIIFAASFFCLSILVLISIFRRKVVVSENDIKCVFIFSKRKMEFADIKGARVESKAIIIESLQEGIKPMVITNYVDLKNCDELRGWVQNNFKDLNTIDLENEHQQLLNNTRLGTTEDERLEKLKRAKTIAIVYNIGATVLGFAMIFFNSILSLYILLSLPLIGICIFYFSYGLTKFLSNLQRSIYRQIFFGISLSSFNLFLSGISFTLFELHHFWLPFLVTTFIFFLLLYTKGINLSIGVLKLQVLTMLIVSAVYGLGTVRSVNCAFDDSSEKIFDAVILEHRVSRGKSTSYFLTLSKWGPQSTVSDFEVGKKLYYNLSVGDTVAIKLRAGLLHIRWLRVTKRVISNQ